ncbi:MAG: M48 family metallopeptidase [Deltaproteobacteria bacterium]|nr:M48 family metallopeptidase [Deltaproteobacteria bacterium]MBW2421132.1 M48 family metallopeptidase [Deltaproteobacteria bacterium]
MSRRLSHSALDCYDPGPNVVFRIDGISEKTVSLRIAALLVVVVVVVAALVACATSPTGRRQLVLFSGADMDAMGFATFDQMKSELPQSENAATNAYVRCVAAALTAALEDPATRTGWEVVVFQDDNANAFALPGKKIGVHTGLLEVAENQHQLAAVVGHEIGHVLAQHSNERVSQQFATQTGMSLAQAVAGSGSATQQTLLGLMGVGAQYGVLLPYSRAHESEADSMGLDLMARAGFHPNESVELWLNMSEAGGAQPPELLSTHPSHESRIQNLEQRLPEAEKLRAAAYSAGKRPRCGP